MKVLCTLLIIAGCAAVGYCVSGKKIAETADDYVGDTKWAKAEYYSFRFWGKNKCNVFVADVLKEAGGNVPHRHRYYSPIGALEWAKPYSTYLTKDRCWMHVMSPRIGDVAAKKGHVGIVTGYRTTTSAAEKKVVKNDWGFRKSPTPTFWRYTC